MRPVEWVSQLVGSIGDIAAPLAPWISASAALVAVYIYNEQRKAMEDQAEAVRHARLPSVQSLRTRPVGDDDLVVEFSNSGGGAAKNLTAVVQLETNADINTGLRPGRTFMMRYFESNKEERNTIKEWSPTVGNKIASGEQSIPFKIICSFYTSCNNNDSETFSKACDRLADEILSTQIEQFHEELSETELDWLRGKANDNIINTIQDYSNERVRDYNFSLRDIETFYSDCVNANNDKVNVSPINLTTLVRLRIDAVFQNVFGEWEAEPIVDRTFSPEKASGFEDIMNGQLQTERVKLDPSGHAQALDMN